MDLKPAGKRSEKSATRGAGGRVAGPSQDRAAGARAGWPPFLGQAAAPGQVAGEQAVAAQAAPPASPARTVEAHGVVAHVHTDPAAGALARSMDALAVTLGSHTYFAPGAFRPGSPEGDRLLRHELAHVAQARSGPVQAVRGVAAWGSPAEREAEAWAEGRVGPVRERAAPGVAHRHPVIPTTAVRHSEADVLGTGPGTGMTLAQLDAWTSAQLDWFIGISETARADLWRMRALLDEGDHIRSGLGAMLVRDLIAVPVGDVDRLRWYAAGSVESANTVHITAPTSVVADALDRGLKLKVLETLIGGAALRVAMPQADFEAIAVDPLKWTRILMYSVLFQPHFEVAEEMPSLQAFLAGADPLAYVTLLGHIRDLHRFPIGLLNDQVRLWATRGQATPPVTLALQSAHDWGMAFQNADQVLLPAMAADPRFRLLIVEGPSSLAAAQAIVEDIGAHFGPIRDVLIIGHGESREIGLANAPGAPSRGSAEFASYPEEKLELTGASSPGGTPTTRFFDALLRNMDPARAQVVFLGCLVGTTQVPQQITDPVTGAVRAPTDAEIRAFYSDPERMAMRSWLEQRPAALGLGGFSPGFAVGARADTGIGAMTSLVDPATGRVRVEYTHDQAAYGSPDDYVRRGIEPTGLLRSLRELMVTSLPAAVAAINHRHSHPAVSADTWWSTMSNTMADFARPSVLAGNLVRVHALEGVAGTTFTAYFLPELRAGDLAGLPLADANALFPTMLATLQPAWPNAAACQLVVHQAWAVLDAVRVPGFAAELDTTPLLAGRVSRLLLPRARLAPMFGTLLPLPAPAAPTRGQLLLAFSLARGSPPRGTPPGAGDPEELQFLYGVASGTRSLPAPISGTLLTGFTSEASLLEAVGLGASTSLAPIAPPSGGATDSANARLGGPSDVSNDVFIHGPRFTATVVPHAVAVHSGPQNAAPSVHWFSRGDAVQVIGVVHGWAAVEYSYRWDVGRSGRLGFIWGDLLSPRPSP